jgi:hypothetical protein
MTIKMIARRNWTEGEDKSYDPVGLTRPAS